MGRCCCSCCCCCCLYNDALVQLKQCSFLDWRQDMVYTLNISYANIKPINPLHSPHARLPSRKMYVGTKDGVYSWEPWHFLSPSTLRKFSCPGAWASQEKIWPMGNLSSIIRCDISWMLKLPFPPQLSISVGIVEAAIVLLLFPD